MSAQPSFTISMRESDIAVLTFDLPDKNANILSVPVLAELEQRLDEIAAMPNLAGLIIISGKPGMFIAGADIREFAASMDITPEKTVEMCRRGQSLFGRLSSLPCVTVAAIDGICVGGGAELAVWCDRRIMSHSSKTQIGFPEVKLGLFPGWGGTARLPRIVGLANAVELITTGNSLDASAAYHMGLASTVARTDKLLDEAIRLVRDEQNTKQYVRDRERWSGPVEYSPTELAFLGATASAMIQRETKGHYPAPMAALEVMGEAAMVDLETALQMEAKGMANLFGSPINAALINVFFLTDRNKKDSGIEGEPIQPRSIASVGVIGSGIMGGGIAAANLKRGLPVVITDANADALGVGVQKVIEEVAYNRHTKKPDAERAIEFSSKLNPTHVDSEIAACDLVIEAIIEKPDVKRDLYSRLEPQMKPDAILASNTSTIPITKLAEGRQRPEQFVGIHFFNPVRRMQLVEVIRGERTSDATVATAVAYAKQIGKMPIVVNDGPGFLVNRLLFPYMNESLALLCDGASIKQVDRAAKAFGMPMGPIELYDMVGLDTAMMAGRTMWEAFPELIYSSPLLPAIVKTGRLGQKNGRGFFSYQNRKGRPEADPEIEQMIGVYQKQPRKIDEQEITHRLFLSMLLEATRVLSAGIVRDVRDIDLGLIFGLGFPPFRGGLLWWADTLGAAKIVELLKPLESLGPRMQPTPLLLKMAEEGRKFYDDPHSFATN
ncbi:MAG: enoyl-CoA hydratase/isomerase family protein [Planctomycetales bacterium]|nr:enoyl-CoA hydratase/isomerase family protein [Planctomycetales bacterium]